MYEHFFKRATDFILALIAAPFVLLVIAVMAPIIYVNDPGPIFYNALRRGRKGKNFTMLKLRSMYVNSPDIRNADGSTFNSNNDPRVTKVGHFMRKMSIDEIPQLLNVLKGDMSFIGPRPVLVSIPYEELQGNAKKRLDVRPGITGYSQAYYRNSIGLEEKFKYDCYYAENVNFFMDLKILFKTIFVVLNSENIYVSNENKPGKKQ